jgi:hypothetical protein
LFLDDVIFAGLGSLRVPLLFRWFGIQLLRLVIWILTPSEYHPLCIMFRILAFITLLVWETIGPPTILYYITTIWNSSVMHCVFLKVERLFGTPQGWFWIGASVMVLDTAWLTWLEWADRVYPLVVLPAGADGMRTVSIKVSR